MYEEIYLYNNASYSIMDTKEMHELLKNDPAFLEEYIKKNTTAPVLLSINEMENTGQNITEENSFTWSIKSTKLFLEAYSERKLQFRDPKVRKKQLWQEIVQILKMHGYRNIDENTLDRKMRNMKRSFKTIKDNNKKSSTGRGRVSWEYYDILEQIFADDKTVNPDNILESTINVEEVINASCQLSTTKSVQNENSSILHTNCITNQSSFSTTPLSDMTNFNDVLPETCLNSPSISTTSSITSHHISDLKSTKNKRSLYNQRKKQIEIEQKRVQAICDLKESLNESNKIQKERNDLIKQLIISLHEERK
ncbi:uncharacterized protein LOC116852256 [Odontomachus brunneus]|uniref:uncharacterized protein LOC116852256 n=1 Tax=Odontomachus brunneus TaxID=486640 RepID=UPI0013F27944|nr:uncharacterized protein LOC116852256 [Odontomachus brunneus]XP_032688330.1 uncharacterized protein LOC116852256 [Odontomachus brunneus]